jgi:hypothetical protein
MAFAGPGDLDIWRARAEALGLGQAHLSWPSPP